MLSCDVSTCIDHVNSLTITCFLSYLMITTSKINAERSVRDNTLEFHTSQFQSTLHVTGCNASAGTMVPCVMGCMYLDGHEHEDVVAYENAFVARWKNYEKQFHTWDSNGIEHQPQNPFPVEGGQYQPRFQLILVTNDESGFYQNDFHKTHWIASTSKATPLPKGDGQSIMMSDFLTSEWGCLLDVGHDDDILEAVFNSLKAHSILTIFLLQGSKGHL